MTTTRALGQPDDAVSGVHRVGFYGLGDIGGPMAKRLQDCDVRLTVFNRTTAKTEPLRAAGAAVATTVADLVAASDILVTCLHGPAADAEAYRGAGGILAQPIVGKLIVNTATIGPRLAVDLGSAVRAAGGEYLDCPILGGGRLSAAQGTLLFPVAGRPAALDRARPVLALLATQIEYVGELGAAQVIKLANNFRWAVASVAWAQAVKFALAGGADPAGLEKILTASDRASSPGTRYLTSMINGITENRGTFRTLAKDLDLANEFARSVSENPTVGEAAAAVFHAGLTTDRGGLDVPALIQVV